MNAVSRFDAAKEKRGRIHVRKYLFKYVLLAGSIVGALLIAGFLFQFFFRYQYVNANGVTWRIDRVTQQTCKVSIGEAQCTPSTPSATVSTSTSTSTSISTSLSVKVVDRKKGKPH
jgi:hypothetical protein